MEGSELPLSVKIRLSGIKETANEWLEQGRFHPYLEQLLVLTSGLSISLMSKIY